jgi:hypothetical protein
MRPNRKLKALVAKLAEVCWDGGALDGGERQQMLVGAGVLIDVIADEPCGPDCRACDAGRPAICYRLTRAYK